MSDVCTHCGGSGKVSGLGIVFTKLVNTCTACPSQWDAWDAEGNYYYIRYRWGRLTVNKGEHDGEIDWDNEIFVKQAGDDLDGWMSERIMLQHIGCSYDGSGT